MIICLSGFVIAGSCEASERVARYSTQHQQLLQHFAALGARCGSSSGESEASAGASPVPGVVGAAGVLGAGGRVRTLYACVGESAGELSFSPNQIITGVAPSGEPGWLRGTLNGRTGLVPENYVEPLP